MLRRNLMLIGGLTLVLSCRNAMAAEPSTDKGLSNCGKQLTITQNLLTKIDFVTVASLSGTDAVVFAETQEQGGSNSSVAFVRRAGRWTGMMLAESASPSLMFRSQSAGDVFLWVMDASAAAPAYYLGAFIPARKAQGFFCTKVDVPSDIRAPDYHEEVFVPTRFNIDASGRGAMIGTVDTDRGTPKEHWYFRYDTTDGGHQWQPSVKMTADTAIPGSFEQATDSEGKALLADLRLSLQSKR